MPVASKADVEIDKNTLGTLGYVLITTGDKSHTAITLQNVYDAIREWEDDLENLDIDSLIDGSGKEGLGGGNLKPITAVLQANVSVRAAPDSKYVTLNGTDDYISTPDQAAFDITGDIEWHFRVHATDWTPATTETLASKWSDGQRSWYVGVNSDGTLRLTWTTDGSTPITVNSTAAPGFVDGTEQWLRIQLDVDNGASGHDVRFYTYDADSAIHPTPSNWQQLGTTVTNAGTTSLFSGTAPIWVGARSESAAVTEPFTGNMHTFHHYTGFTPGGTRVLSLDAGIFSTGDMTGEVHNDSLGIPWTLNGTNIIVAEPVTRIFTYDGGTLLSDEEAAGIADPRSPLVPAAYVEYDRTKGQEGLLLNVADLERLRQWMTNRQELTEAATDNFILYEDDGVTVAELQTVLDKDGNPISLPTGLPARRSNSVEQ